jgi:hypothetical protein
MATNLNMHAKADTMLLKSKIYAFKSLISLTNNNLEVNFQNIVLTN